MGDINRQFQLKDLNNELTAKLTRLDNAKIDQEIFLQHQFQDEQNTNMQKVENSFGQLNDTGNKLTAMYTDTSSMEKDYKFFYQQPIQEVFLGEELFTASLTEYTRKQFFEGIADLAGSRDKLRYDLLDVSEPEASLIKGQSEDTWKRNREELQRLHSQYSLCENNRINAELSCASLKSAVETAEKQLKMLSSNSLNITQSQIENEIVRISEDLRLNKMAVSQLHETELKPLLQELQQLQSTKVLKGNYDLKITRQDYFLSKQNEVINQLLLQCSRNYFLSMLYEIELKEHQSFYHLLATANVLLNNEIENIEKRITMLSDPLLLSANLNKETITSRDSFINKIHDAVVPASLTTRDILYKTYSNVLDEAKCLQTVKNEIEHENIKICEERKIQFQNIETLLKESADFLCNNNAESNAELSSLMNDVEENLSIAESQINDIIKDIVSKRKILSTDSYKMIERTLFANFFNDPTRLKRILTEIQTRVNVLASTTS